MKTHKSIVHLLLTLFPGLHGVAWVKAGEVQLQHQELRHLVHHRVGLR